MEYPEGISERYRREDRRMNLWMAAAVLVLVGLIVAWVLAVQDFQEDCESAGGGVQTEYIGEVPIYDGNGNVTGSVENYAYHCLDQDGEEIEIG